MKKALKYAILHALATGAYIALLVSSVFYGSRLFEGTEETILAPILMLCVLVFSAAVTGSLVFGRPVIWYLDGKKKEALTLLFYTLGSLLILIVLILLIIFAAIH